ncbi:MAG: hypothetical protein HFG40_03070 [Bacilli bacterium]|nr:hypothetical protein [Bacilli bacterium]
MNDQYLLTQKLNEYKEFKRTIVLVSQSLTDGVDHLKICTNKLSDYYDGYGDGVNIIKLSENLQISKDLIVNRIIPEIELQIKMLLEQLTNNN